MNTKISNQRTTMPIVGDTTDAVAARINENLDRLEDLTQLLAAEDGYDVPELGYEVPVGFKLSVVIPVFNEEDTIRQILSRVLAQRLPMEVIVVDDCSVDMTRDVLRQLEGHPQVKFIYKPKNEGKGAALRTGFEHATGDIVVVQDADVGSSRVDLQACKLEYSIVSPK